MKRPKSHKAETGFTLIEVVIALLIGLIGTLAASVLFIRGNQAAVNQEDVSEMNLNLNNSAVMLRRAITFSGFGLRTDPDFALRTINNFSDPAVYPQTKVGVNGPNTFSVKAMPHSDAIMTVNAIPGKVEDPGCERLEIEFASSTLPFNQGGDFTLNGCLPDPIDPTTCNAREFRTGDAAYPWDRKDFFKQEGRSFLVINQSLANPSSVTLKVSNAFINTGDPAICSNGTYIQIIGKGEGLQVHNSWTPANPSDRLIGRLIEAKFFYLGEDKNLYQIPGNYFGDEDGTLEPQKNRIIAQGIEEFYIGYFMHDDQNGAAPRNIIHGGGQSSGGGINDPAGSGFEQSADIRQVDFSLVARSARFDSTYNGQTIQIADLGDPDPPISSDEHYRRRIHRENVFARNLGNWGNGRGNYNP